MRDQGNTPFGEAAARAFDALNDRIAGFPVAYRDHIDQAALQAALKVPESPPKIGDEVIDGTGTTGILRQVTTIDAPYVYEDLISPGTYALRVGFVPDVMATIDTPLDRVEMQYNKLCQMARVKEKTLEIAGADVGPVMLKFAALDGSSGERVVIPRQEVPEFGIDMPDLIRLVSRIREFKRDSTLPDGTTAWRYVQTNGSRLFEPVSQEFTRNPPVPYALRSDRVLVTGSGSSYADFMGKIKNGTLDTRQIPALILEQLTTDSDLQAVTSAQNFWAAFFNQSQFADLPGSVPDTLIDTGEMRSYDYIGGSTLSGSWLGDRLRQICETWGVRYLRIQTKGTEHVLP